MSDFINAILQWINANPELAGFATFLISAAESIAIVGTIVPGTVMMTAVGTLAGAGVMPLWSTIVWAILGAIVGDGISYWFGHHFKDRLRDMWPFRNYPSLLDSGMYFFHKHGGKSVFIGRFVGPVRAIVPLVAGMLGMKPWRFFVANVLSAIGWAPAYMLPGIVLGAASLELPPDIAVHAILMLLLIGLFTILCVWLLIKFFHTVQYRIHRTLTRLWDHLLESRYFSPITTALQHYDVHKTHGQLTLAFYIVLTFILFLWLATYIHFHHSQDIYVNNLFFYLFRSLRTPFADNLFLSISMLGEFKILVIPGGILFVWLAWQKRFRTALHVLALIVLTFLSVEFFKHWVQSPRPWGITTAPRGSSFPSGHTTSAVVFYLGFALLINKITEQKYQRLVFITTIFVVVAIGISRLYLGAHWFTDIVGGVLLGAALLMLIVLSYNRQREKEINLSPIFLITFIALGISYSAYSLRFYHQSESNYAQVDWPAYNTTLKFWWEQNDKRLPLYRLNRIGSSTQILNLQWLGNLNDIKEILLKNGWEIPPDRNWITVLHRVSNVQSTEHLPLLSPLYLDKNPVLILIKRANDNKKLTVLRLWNSHVMIDQFPEPLWVGTVELVPSTYSWLLKRGRSIDVKLSTQLLFSKAPENYTIKPITVKNLRRHQPERQQIILIKPKNT